MRRLLRKQPFRKTTFSLQKLISSLKILISTLTQTNLFLEEPKLFIEKQPPAAFSVIEKLRYVI